MGEGEEREVGSAAKSEESGGQVGGRWAAGLGVGVGEGGARVVVFLLEATSGVSA